MDFVHTVHLGLVGARHDCSLESGLARLAHELHHSRYIRIWHICLIIIEFRNQIRLHILAGAEMVCKYGRQGTSLYFVPEMLLSEQFEAHPVPKNRVIVLGIHHYSVKVKQQCLVHTTQIISFHIIEFVEEGAESLAVFENPAEFSEPRRIRRFGNPELEVAALGVLFGHMVEHTLPVSFTVKLRVMRHPELHRAPDYGLSIDLTVSLGHDAPINAARLASVRSPVVLHSLRHYFYLLLAEPFAQPGVPAKQPSRHQMMGLPVLDEPRIVVSCNDIHHIRVQSVMLRKLQALTYHVIRVVPAVSRVKSIVARQNLSLNIFLQHSLQNYKIDMSCTIAAARLLMSRTISKLAGITQRREKQR